MKHRNVCALIGFIVLVSAACLHAQEQPEVQITAETLGKSLYMLQDSGGMGNTTILTGNDGVLMVDTKVNTSVDRLLAKISEMSAKPIRFVIITHWHFDHVGGNEKLAAAGATIIAHENVRKQMGTAHDMEILNVKVPPSPEPALPLATYTREMQFHMNGEDVRVFHLGPGHTDGDSIVFLPTANVMVMGDLYFEGLYPYIGIYSGGSINSMIAVIRQLIPMINDQTKIIPGHGPVSDKAHLQAYLSMLIAIQDIVSRLIQEGKTKEQVVAAKPTQAFDKKWGNGFLTPDQFAGLVYMDLSPELP